VQAANRLLAAIDVGTNTVRMLIAAEGPRGIRPVRRLRRITGLGKGLRATGAIGQEELRASLAALKGFRREMDRLGVVEYRACGTAGLREASNRDSFLSAARAGGVEVEVVTAGEEARLTWAGAVGRLKGAGTVIIDIGGGSTEFIAGPREAESASLPLGVVALSAAFPLSDPPEPWQLSNLRHFLAERIASGTAHWSRRRFRRIVGTAGTFTTLAALQMRMREYRPDRIDGFRMSLRTVRAWESRLSRMTSAQRLALPGMEKGRERFIVPGVCEAVAAMERFGMDELTISDAGLLEGIAGGLRGTKGRG
jgi:exopolyphosphatase / guanosine-5'-triphosphate,3'-diphosphate pyrophosphatase